MYIDENVMREYLGKIDEIDKSGILKRFSEVKRVFENIKQIKSFNKEQKFPKAKWKDGVFDGVENTNDIPRAIFAPSKIDLTAGERYKGVKFQQDYFQCLIEEKQWGKAYGDADFIKNILSIIGGFDSCGKMKDEYRILSNAQTSKDDFNSTLQSNGQYAWINSHFADNTLFCEFVDFVKKCKVSDGNNKVESEWYKNIALCYPYADDKKTIGKLSGSKGDIEQEETDKQQDILAYRFPLKFLWMWANKDSVIHPLSLMAFREFLKSEFMSEIFKDLSEGIFSKFDYDNGKTMEEETSKYAERITNAKIECFPEIWKKVSDKIMEKLQLNKSVDDIHQLSLLISLLTLGETDMTNIDELLKTHKQIILYGVPGTGKTHSAKELIKNKIKQDWDDNKDKMKDYQFGVILNNKSDLFTFNAEKEIQPKKNEAIWDIMQFHPNTTYQDFIGGIIPKTEEKNKSLTYEVESGKFKRFCEYASANKDKKFIFIIDEINRANLSEVLGELLYALEYRDEGITIPNFNEPFVIPSNVYIIGTMNNVDKSLATFDLALRRRFGFYEVKPDLDALNEMLSFEKEQENNIQVKSEDKEEDNSKPLIADLEEYIVRCKNLNKKIMEKLSDKNSQIGQAYFKKIEDFLKKEEENQIVTPFHLQKLWDYHLEPLLQEYVGFVDNGENKIEDLKKAWLGKVEEQQ